MKILHFFCHCCYFEVFFCSWENLFIFALSLGHTQVIYILILSLSFFACTLEINATPHLNVCRLRFSLVIVQIGTFNFVVYKGATVVTCYHVIQLRLFEFDLWDRFANSFFFTVGCTLLRDSMPNSFFCLFVLTTRVQLAMKSDLRDDIDWEKKRERAAHLCEMEGKLFCCLKIHNICFNIRLISHYVVVFIHHTILARAELEERHRESEKKRISHKCARSNIDCWLPSAYLFVMWQQWTVIFLNRLATPNLHHKRARPKLQLEYQLNNSEEQQRAAAYVYTCTNTKYPPHANGR